MLANTNNNKISELEVIKKLKERIENSYKEDYDDFLNRLKMIEELDNLTN